MKKFNYATLFKTPIPDALPKEEGEQVIRYRFVRSVMVRCGVKNIEISKLAGTSKQRVHDVMMSVAKGYRIRRIIAEQCGVEVEQLWPDTPESQRRSA